MNRIDRSEEPEITDEYSLRQWCIWYLVERDMIMKERERVAPPLVTPSAGDLTEVLVEKFKEYRNYDR